MTSATVPAPKISSTRLNSKRPTRPQLRAPTMTSASHTGSVRLISSIAPPSCDGLCETSRCTLETRSGYTAVRTFSFTAPVRPRAGRHEPPLDVDLAAVQPEDHAGLDRHLDGVRLVAHVVDEALDDTRPHRAPAARGLHGRLPRARGFEPRPQVRCADHAVERVEPRADVVRRPPAAD